MIEPKTMLVSTTVEQLGNDGGSSKILSWIKPGPGGRTAATRLVEATLRLRLLARRTQRCMLLPG